MCVTLHPGHAAMLGALWLGAAATVQGAPPELRSRVMRALEGGPLARGSPTEAHADLTRDLVARASQTLQVQKEAGKTNNTVVIVLLVVVLVCGVPLLFFVGRMFWRLWKHPRAVHYTGTATADEDELVHVNKDVPSSMNGQRGYGLGGLDHSRTTSDATIIGDDIRASFLSHDSQPSISIISPTADGHGHHERMLSSPVKENADSPTKQQSPISRKPPPSLMMAESSVAENRTGSSVPPAAAFVPSSPPIIRAPVPQRAHQPMPRVSSPESTTSSQPRIQSAFATPRIPRPTTKTATSPTSTPRTYAPYSPPRNPYRGTISPTTRQSLTQSQYSTTVSAVPDPIAPPPRPPVLGSPPPISTSPSNSSAPSSGATPRIMGPRKPGGPRRSQIYSTMSITSDSTDSETIMAMTPQMNARGVLSPTRR